MLPLHSCNGAVIHSKVLHCHISSKDLLKDVLFNMVLIYTQTKYVMNTKHLGLEALMEESVTSLQCIVYDCTHY